MNLKIPQATSKGYIEVKPYGAFDWSYPESLTRRGRVQGDHGDIAPTIMCQNEIYVYEGIEEWHLRHIGGFQSRTRMAVTWY